MPTIRLQALDTLFFRDGKPFSMGDDTFAEGVFPPAPSVIYGALRSAYISQNLENKSLEELIKESEGLEIKKIAFQLDNSYLYPMPQDYVELKEEEGKAIALREIKDIISNSSQQILFYSDEHVEQVKDGLFTSSQMKNYVNGIKRKYTIHKWDSYLSDEEKFGNKRDNSSRSTSSENGGLYRVLMKRPAKDINGKIKELSIVVEYEFKEDNEKKLNSGICKLGAEGKLAQFSEDDNLDSFPIKNTDTKNFKILIQTPTMIKSINRVERLHTHLKKFEIEIKRDAAIIGKSTSIGGWDIKSRRPKPMVKVVPTGSLFLYTIKSENKTLKDVEIALSSLTSLSEIKEKEGFGQFILCNK